MFLKVVRGLTDPVRVCVVTPFGSTAGGAEAWLLGVLDSALNPRGGFEVSAVVLQEGPLRKVLDSRGVHTDVVPTGATPASILASAPRLGRIIRRQRPDVLVANGVKAQLMVALVNRPRPRASIWVKHDHSFDRWLARPLGLAAGSVVATAYEVGEATRRRDLIVIEPPRPDEPLEREASRDRLAALGLGRVRPLTLAMVARLVPYKGVDVAINALARREASQWQLVVIGSDDESTPGETERLRNLASSAGVEDRVFFLGRVESAGRLLAGVDALAVLTRPDGPRTPGREGYGMVAAEAMLAGVPVVVAGAGPIASRITSGHPAGIVLASADSDLVAGALMALSVDRVRQEMGAAGRELAVRQHDARAVGLSFAEVVRNARLGHARDAWNWGVRGGR